MGNTGELQPVHGRLQSRRLGFNRLTRTNHHSMPDPYETVRQKVTAIFAEVAGERSKMLDGLIFPAGITTTITAALSVPESNDTGILNADQIAFHLTDWNADAAFLVALHLFPERFTQEEVRAGVDLFLVHVPAHIIAAARLSGNSNSDTFADDDKT
jgi:uncharacterized membrane protein (GlpM family)